MTRRLWDETCEEVFMRAIMDTYLSLPQSPDDVTVQDRGFAFGLFREGYQLYKVEAALLLGTARRIFSNPHSFQPTTRSLSEFAPYIEELRDEDLEIDYVRYLRHLLSPVLGLKQELLAQGRK